jgi:hypothetical protein
MMEEYDTVVITHGGCADGVTSAHMFELFPDSSLLGRVRIYHSYDREFAKNKNMPSVVGKKVFITDYSFPISTLINIASVAQQLYLWDHHETAFKEMFTSIDGSVKAEIDVGFSVIFTETENYVSAGASVTASYVNNFVRGFNFLRNQNDIFTESGKMYITAGRIPIKNICKVNIIFDMDLCGSEITFKSLSKMHSGGLKMLTPPWYLGHIRDRDMWLWDKPGNIEGIHYSKDSKPFGEAFFELQIKTQTLQLLDLYSKEDREKMYARGRELMEHNARFVKLIVSKAERVTFAGYPALVATSAVLQSEIGNTMIKWKPLNPADTFAPVIGVIIRYNLEGKRWDISLRGGVDSPNVAEIAKKYGGGGHKAAAGFEYVGYIDELFTVITSGK